MLLHFCSGRVFRKKMKNRKNVGAQRFSGLLIFWHPVCILYGLFGHRKQLANCHRTLPNP